MAETAWPPPRPYDHELAVADRNDRHFDCFADDPSLPDPAWHFMVSKAWFGALTKIMPDTTWAELGWSQ